MDYFSIFLTRFTPKNNLEQEIIYLLHNKSRLLVKKENLEGFKNEILHEIRKLNASNNNCMPKNPEWSRMGIKNDDYMLIGAEATFYIYSINNLK